MTVKERIKYIAKIKERSVRAFETKVGFSNGYINSIRKSIQPDKIECIASNYPDINIGWLLTGEGPMLNSEKSEVTHVIPDETIVAPLISQYAYGGYMRGFADPVYIKDQPTYTARVKHNGGKYVAFEVKGDSMDDRSYRSICEGDLVLGRELQKEYWTSRLHIPKVFIIVHKEEGVVIKEIVEHDVETGRILCHSWNPLPEYEDFELNLKDVFQLFYIKEITRNVKY